MFGQHLCEYLVDAEIGGHRVGDLPSVAGDHRDFDSAGVQGVDRLAGFFADCVFKRDRAEHLIAFGDV